MITSRLAMLYDTRDKSRSREDIMRVLPGDIKVIRLQCSSNALHSSSSGNLPIFFVIETYSLEY